MPISLAGLAPVQDEVEARVVAQGVPRHAALRLRLVIEELVANLVEHAAWTNGPVPARLEVSWQDGALAAALEDAARAFDPRQAPAPPVPRLDDDRLGGQGLALVRRMTDGLRYLRIADGWNRTEFTVRLA